MPKHVVITGGSRGIGLAIAMTLARNDYHPIIIARTAPTTECGSFISWDLSKTNTFKELAAKLRGQFHNIYGLVNNAGIGSTGILTIMSDAQIAQVMHMNAVAPITLTKYLLRPMMAARSGRIINISSIVASNGFQGLSAYSASKAALVGFTRSLAREVGPLGITVNAVAPGFIDTEMTHSLDDKHRHQITKRSALQRMATADDVANSVLFLLSDGASNITGSTLTVDAGGTA